MEINNLIQTIQLPKGWEVDQEASTKDKIVPKVAKKQKRFVDDEKAWIEGYYIERDSTINRTDKTLNFKDNYNIFAHWQQARSALAMARISQIMENDKRFGGIVTDKEWENGNFDKYVINRYFNRINTTCFLGSYEFLAFHTEGQRDLFLKENEQLVKDYLMID